MELNVSLRTTKGKSVKILRKRDIIPAVIYGHKITSQLLQVNYPVFERIYEKAGESTLIDLKIDNKAPVKVLIHEVKLDPLTNRFSHVDFYQIRKGEKITAEIELEFIGESKAVKELGGVLVKNLTKIKVECLPEDLIHAIKVDISKLNIFGDLIKVQDLTISEKLKVKDKPDEVVVLVTPPREEEKEEVKEEITEEKIEGEEATKEKKEEAMIKETPKETQKEKSKESK